MQPIPPAAERRIRRESRSATLRERALALRSAGWTYAQISEALGVSVGRTAQIVRKADRLLRNPHWYDALPVRAQTFLHYSGLAERPEAEAACAVAQLSRRELLQVPNFGRAACAALIVWLSHHGLTLQRETPTAFARRRAAERDSVAE